MYTIDPRRVWSLNKDALLFKVDERYDCTWLEEGCFMKLAKYVKAKTFFEFGTGGGAFTKNLSVNFPLAKIYTLDLAIDEKKNLLSQYSKDHPEYDNLEPFLKPADFSQFTNVVQLWGNSSTVDFSRFCGSVDAIFIDGSHEKDIVKMDTENALKMATKFITWHDVPSWPGPMAAVDGLTDIYHVNGTNTCFKPICFGVERIDYDESKRVWFKCLSLPSNELFCFTEPALRLPGVVTWK